MKSLARGLLAALLLLATPAFADDVSNGSYSTTDGSNTAAPPNGWPAGMFPNQVEPAARANMGATKRWWERANPTLSTTGSAGAYVITPSNTSYPTAYTQGEVTCAKSNFTSVGNDTLNVNGLGAKPIYVQGTSSINKIAASTILSGAMFCVAYDGALNSAAGGFQLISTTFPSGLGAAALKGVSNNSYSNVPTLDPAFGFAGPDFAQYIDSTGTLVDGGWNHNSFDAAGAATTAASAAQSNAESYTNSQISGLHLANMSTVTETVSTSGPSGTGATGDIWIQY